MKTAAEFLKELDARLGTTWTEDDAEIQAAFDEYASQFKPKWISVEERLPDETSIVIVCCEYGVTTAEFTKYANGNILWWATKYFGTYEDSTQAHNVTYWMPLPEAPNK